MPVRDLILNLKEKKSGRALLDAANDLDRAADGVDRFADRSKDAARDLAGLNHELQRATARASDLRSQFARTGDRGLFGDIGKEEAAIRRIRRLIGNQGGGGNLLGSIPNIGGVPGPLIAGGAAAVAALSPAIGATIAAAVLGGVGTGGLIGGVALASQDTRVQAAFKDFGTEAFRGLSDASSPLVKPLVGAAHKFGDAWRKELPAVQQDFRILAQAVDPIAGSLTGFVHNLHPGLTTALKASIPIAAQFEKEFSGFGTATGEFLRDMARSAPGAKIALHDLFTVIDMGLDHLGDGVKILSGAYEGMRKLGLVAPPEWLMQMSQGTLTTAIEILNPELTKASNNLRDVYTPTQELARAQEDAADAAKSQADAIAKLNKQVDDYYDGILGPLDAEERWAAALLDTADALRENGRTLDIHTRQGLANRDAIEEQFLATKNRLDQGTLTEQQYQREIDKLAALGTKFHDTTGFVAGLVEAYRRVPSEIRSTLSVTAGGSGLSILLRLLKGTVSGKMAFSMGEHSGGQIGMLVGSTAGLPGPGHGAFIEGFAGGGTTPAFRPFRVHAGETLWSDREHFVATASQTRAMGGGAQVMVTLDPALTGPSRDLAAAMLGLLRYEIRTGYGGDPVLALGQR
jgi:hypothetical protein